MRYFLIGLVMMIVLCIILYFVLSKLYDYISFRSGSEEIRREQQQQRYEMALEKERLIQRKAALEHAIDVRSQHFQQMSEIKQLEKELIEINETIETIETRQP